MHHNRGHHHHHPHPQHHQQRTTEQLLQASDVHAMHVGRAAARGDIEGAARHLARTEELDE